MDSNPSGVLVLIPVAIIAIVKFVKSRKAKAEPAEEADPADTARALALARLKRWPPGLRLTTMKVWKNFLKEIPPHFVVACRSLSLSFFSEALEAVSHRWSSNTRTGDDSQSSSWDTPDPNLQVYLGSRVVIQELPQPSEQQHKTSRTALKKLSTLSENPPSVVIVVSATRLPTMTRMLSNA